MYVRSGRIVRAFCSAEASSPTTQDTSAHSRRQTLWASRAWPVPGGRLVAVRFDGRELRVGLVTPDGQLRWVRQESVLSANDALRWTKSATFVK
jgi:hypothetical protein